MEGTPSVARSSSYAFRFGAMRLLVLDTLKHNCAAGNREQVPEYSQILQQLCGLKTAKDNAIRATRKHAG